MSTIINLDWDHKEKNLFLGQELGIADYVNVKYPRLEELALLQRSQFWVETEISLESDKKQWPTLTESIRNKTLLNLAWQTLADSIITRAPENAIMKLVSRPELEGMLIQWGYFENIHSRAYSNIIRNVLPNPGEFIATVQKNEEAFARLAMPVAVLDELSELGDLWLQEREMRELAREDDIMCLSDMEFQELTEQVQQKILEVYFATYGLEAIMFYASFACTFALAENDILTGVAKNLQLIAKDEALHTVMAKEVLNILMGGQIPSHVVAKAKDNAPQILRDILQTEINWAHYIFPEGEDIPGLNAELLTEYLYYNARLAFLAIGIEWPSDLPLITKDPIPWMNGWLDTKNQQVAPQEAQLTNYRVASTTQVSDESLGNLGAEFEDMF